jgi:VRR-NUC domain-containing protein
MDRLKESYRYEKDFQRDLADYARSRGWYCVSIPAVKYGKGRFGTPRVFDNEGWVDLVLVGRQRLIFVELKTNKGRVRAAQKEWHKRLENCGLDVRVWRPKDRDEIIKTIV